MDCLDDSRAIFTPFLSFLFFFCSFSPFLERTFSFYGLLHFLESASCFPSYKADKASFISTISISVESPGPPAQFLAPPPISLAPPPLRGVFFFSELFWASRLGLGFHLLPFSAPGSLVFPSFPRANTHPFPRASGWWNFPGQRHSYSF